MTPFQKAVLQAVRLIPTGKVASYGQIAAYVGAPRAARQVGWAMRSLGAGTPDFPWWRVLNNAGRISIKGSYIDAATLQKEYLEAEGVVVAPDFTLNIERYRFRPTATKLAPLALDPAYVRDRLALD